jgi:hypothetical protein
LVLFVLFVSSIPLSAQNIVITDTTSTDVTCGGGSDGTITVTISGGVPPYKYGLLVGFSSIDSARIFLSNSTTPKRSGSFTWYPKIVAPLGRLEAATNLGLNP